MRIINIAIAVFIILLGGLSCTFNLEDNTQLIMTRIDTEGSTTSPWPTFKFAFNRSVVDSVSFISIIPDNGVGFNSKFNESNDTLTVKVTGVLDGKRLYSVVLNRDITASNGSVLKSGDVDFPFMTYPKEKLPNSTFSNSDTLLPLIFGVAAPINDSDYFYIADTSVSEVFLINHFGSCGFEVVTALDSVVQLKSDIYDTLYYKFDLIPAKGLYLRVFSVVDNGARYEIGYR